MTIFTVFSALFWLQILNLPVLLQNKNTRIGPFRFVLQNPDRERTNQSTGVYLRLALPYNKRFYHTWMAKRRAIYCPRDGLSFGRSKRLSSAKMRKGKYVPPMPKMRKEENKMLFPKSWNVPLLRCKNANCPLWSWNVLPKMRLDQRKCCFLFTTLLRQKAKIKKSITCSEGSNIIYNV